MNIRMLTIGVGCALVAACGAPPPSASAPSAGVDMRLDPPPVHALLGQRSHLKLTSEQITALDSVGQDIHAQNHPLLMKLSDLDRSGSNLQAQQQMLHLAGRVHLNNHRAMERVRGILTSEQREAACNLYNGSRGSARALRSLQSPDLSTRTTRTSETVGIMSRHERGAVWNWCAEGALPMTAAR
jgi:hypothetical protein